MALLNLTRGFLPPIVSSLLRKKYLRNNTSELFCHDGKLSTQMLNSCCCKLCFFLSDLQIIGSIVNKSILIVGEILLKFSIISVVKLMYSTQLGEYKIIAEAVVEMRVKTLKIIFL